MTIWILALILVGACVALGHKLGAINAAITFIGIPIAALLAGPLSRLVAPLLPHLGVQNPFWLWALPPFIVCSGAPRYASRHASTLPFRTLCGARDLRRARRRHPRVWRADLQSAPGDAREALTC